MTKPLLEPAASLTALRSQEGTPPPSPGGQPPQVPAETAKEVDACVGLGLPLPRAAAG